MGVHTEKSLQKLFEASRARNEKKKQEEQLKYKKAQESIKKALAKQQTINAKKLAENAQKQQKIEFSRIITIYNSKYIERFIGEDDLYVTREQLKEAEQRGEGSIRWNVWDSIVNKTRKELEK